MLTKTCPECRQRFALADARMDEHWNKASFDPAYCYCPHCGGRLEGVHFDSVELARILTPKYLVWALLVLGVAGVGLVSNPLGYVGPLLVGTFGLRLARRSRVRDHRIIGWVLVLIAASALYAFNPA
jgi:hypothetical protein